MRKIYQATLLVMFLFVFCYSPEVGATTADLIKEAKNISRRRKIEPTVNAYAKVFAAKDLTISQRVAGHLDIARVMMYGRKPHLKDAIAECEKALALSGLSEEQSCALRMMIAKARYKSNYIDKRGSYHTRGIDAAQIIYEQVGKTKEAGPKMRIDAYNALADCLLDKNDTARALVVLKKAVAIPGLNQTERDSAEFNLIKGYRRLLQYDKALAMLKKLQKTTKNNLLKSYIRREILSIYATTDKYSAGAKYLKESGRSEYDIAIFYLKDSRKSHERKEKAINIFQKIVADPKTKERIRWNAMNQFMRAESNFNKIMSFCDKYLGAFVKTSPKRITTLLIYFSRNYIGPYYVRYNSRTNPRFVIWAGEKLLAYDKLRKSDYPRIANHMINAYLDMRNIPKAIKLAKSVADNATLDAEVREKFKLIAAAIDSKTKVSELTTSTRAYLKRLESEKATPEKRLKTVEDIAKVANRAVNYPATLALDSIRREMIQARPRRSLNCDFVENAPSDISAWISSKYINEKGRYGVMDRKYGDNLKNLLATDAAITGREVNAGAVKSGDADRFSIVCDVDGLHLFLLAPCSNFRDVADGLEKTSSYEMYLAAGKNEPYHTFIVNTGRNSFFDSFHTMYRNKGYRLINRKNETLFWDSKPTEKGVGLYLRIPWIALYDKLPSRGDKYEFDSIHWVDGGRSWGGSKSVHNRSSFGDIVFANMSAKNLNSIKRRIIKKAFEKYKKQKVGNHNGVIDFWEDPKLGDPEFYDACLRKMVAELDEYGTMVKKGMSDDDVELLFKNAVPKWMEIEYVVADLRRKYMSDKLFAEKKR